MDNYFKIDVGVRYWKDGTINGEDDISYEEQKNGVSPRMPFAISTKNGEYRWVLTINLKNGCIIDWPNNVMANIHYKVCDDGVYSLLDENENEIYTIDCYVPKILAFNDFGYGDYIIFDVDNNGHIMNWPDENTVQKLIEEFKKTKGF